jgi:hypothetical protein
MKESFANSFAKGTESLLAQQDKKLASREQFPPPLPEPLVKETPLQYRKGKRRAMTGLEVTEERERDASQQRGRKEREAEEQEEARILEAEWVADTQLELQLSQLSYLEDDFKQQEQQKDADADAGPGPGSQYQPLEVLSDSEIDGSPRHSGRVKRVTRTIESQQWQIDQGLIPAPGEHLFRHSVLLCRHSGFA